jgi:heparan-alpha-glucosaminide N-acetyltransferase
MLLFAPDIPGCGRGSLSSSCNAVGYIDQLILRPAHMYSSPTCKEADPPCLYFDPEGLVSTLAASASCYIGLYMGYILAKFSDHKHRLGHWIGSGIVMVILGVIIHFAGIPFNKNLYSLSYVLVMAGSASILFSACYAAIDIPQNKVVRIIMLPMIAMGMNSIAVYAFDHFWGSIFGRYLYWGKPDQTLFSWIYRNLYASWMETKVAVLFWALTDTVFNMIFAGILYKMGVFFKI